MIVQIVRFKSELSEDEIMKLYDERAPRYRETKGLKEKYYLKFPETEEYGAVYFWDNQSSLDAFRDSDLGKTISSSYKVQGSPKVLAAELVMTLHDSLADQKR